MRGKFFILFAVAQFGLLAQPSAIEQAIEYLVEFGQTENASPDLVQLAEQLTYLQNNPVSLNSATADELLEIPLLNSYQVFGIINYRKRAGSVVSYFQLIDIKGLNKEVIDLLRYFTTLERAQKSAAFPTTFQQQAAFRYNVQFQRVRGISNNVYQGDASAAYLRYRLQGDDKLFAGITAQKDAGEPWLYRSQPDFFSIHAEYRPNKLVKNVVLGDFSVEFGQGLVLWSSLAFNKSSEAISIERFGRKLRHYTGADENRFLRGIGSTIQFNDWELTAFYSQNKHDANTAINDQGERVATSLQTAGTHRTSNEREDKNALDLRIAGSYIQWRPERLRIGLLTSATQFSIPLQFANRLENVHRFSGNQLVHNSLDFKWLYGTLFLFGEVGFEWQNQATAAVAGLKVNAADALQWTLQFRHLDRDWFAPMSQPFSETGNGGERGVYLGINWRLGSSFTLAAFADHFQYLWLRSTTNSLGNGGDYMAQLNYSARQFNTYLRARFQNRLRTLPGDEVIRNSIPQNRYTFRWHATYNISPDWALQSRIEHARSTHAETSTGWLMFVGLRYNPTPKWQFRLRYTVFDTDDFSSAIYAFEDDVPYTFSVPAFSENGSRWYLMATYKITNTLDIWIRLSDTFYPDLSALGNGNDQVEGGRRTTFKTMIRISF